jgi:hypothetical protein
LSGDEGGVPGLLLFLCCDEAGASLFLLLDDFDADLKSEGSTMEKDGEIRRLV